MAILKATSEGVFVDFSGLTWYYIADPLYKQKYLDYFAKQGFAEAEKLPYQRTKEGLIVQWQPNAELAGWQVAVSADEIPF